MNNWQRPGGTWQFAVATALAFSALAVRADEAAGKEAAEAAQTAQADAQAAAQAAQKARDEAHQQLKEAHERLEQDARRVAELSMAASGAPERIERRIIVRRGGHAQLGVMIDDTAEGAGVHVRAVTPGSPAEAAGLRADDTIVSLGGTPLAGDGGGQATKRLMELLADAKPGQPLAIEWRRDGKLAKAQVVPRKPEPMEEMGGPEDLPMIAALHGAHGMGELEGLPLLMGERRGLGATQLVELSPGLGSYFGADKGLLVVRAPADSRYRLQDGDVLLDIDGRVPAGVSHALQILASYRAGETVRLHVMRQKKRIELAVEVPGG